MLSRLVIAFPPKRLLVSWLQSPSAVDANNPNLKHKETKVQNSPEKGEGGKHTV